MSILESIGGAIATGLIFLAGLLGYNPEPTYAPTDDLALGADTVLPLGGQTYTLAGSGISSSATSFTLTSFTIPQNGKKIQDSEMGDTFYITFETGSRTRQEFASCTTVVQNVDNTATISGCVRGLSPVSPYTASTSLQFAHGGGTSVIFSNSPQFYNQFAAKGNDETITGNYIFTGQVTMSTFPITSSSSPASATTTGTVELATGGEAASSTLSGDIAASKLALHTGIATSAAPTSGNVVVVTGDDGNIDAGFLPFPYPVITEYTASTTYTKSTGLKYIELEMWGAGGGGAGASTDSPGGGGGAYVSYRIDASLIGSTASITIGRGGNGGTAGASGSAGSSTMFTLSSGTVIAYGGAGGTANLLLGANGGGIVSHGTTTDTNYPSTGLGSTTPWIYKGIGQLTGTYPDTYWGGAPGGACNGTNSCSNGGGTIYAGGGGGGGRSNSNGSGGASLFGGAGGAGVTTGTASNGSAPAGGGGGAGNSGTGGNGANGKVRITEYF